MNSPKKIRIRSDGTEITINSANIRRAELNSDNQPNFDHIILRQIEMDSNGPF
jgi:hypothetical protein